MVDLVLIIIILLGIFWGYKAGFIKVLAGPGSLVGGIIIARRLTPLLMPWLEDNLGWSADKTAATDFWHNLYFAQSGTGKVVETILFVVIVGVVIWLLRLVLNVLGNIINMTPLLGFLSRLLGAALGLIISGFVIYVVAFMLIPWLHMTMAAVPLWTKLIKQLDKSAYVLPYINDIGSWIWYSTAGHIGHMLPLKQI